MCKRFRELAQDSEIWSAWLHALPREEWPCINPFQTREESNFRQIVIRSLKTTKSWSTGSPTITKHLHITDNQNGYLRILPGGRYILTSSSRVISCVDALAGESERTVFRFSPSDSGVTIHAIGFDMLSASTVVIAVALMYDDDR